MAICEFRVFFREMARIGKKNAAEILCCGGAQHMTPEPLFYEQRQITRMVEVSVREENALDRTGFDGKWCPIPQSKCFVPLKKPAID